jgi:hypothetical protein
MAGLDPVQAMLGASVVALMACTPIAVLEGDFIVALTSDQKLIEGRLKEPYLRRRFHLRDSMDECTVWFREALFAPWFSESVHGKPERIVPAQIKEAAPKPKPIP